MKTQNQKSKLTKNEKEVLVALMKNAQANGENGWEYLIDEVIVALNKSEKSVAATVGSLQKKGLVDCYDENEYYFSGEVTAEGFKEFQKIESEVTLKKRKISDMTESERQEFNEFLGGLPQDSYGNARVEEWLEARGFEITEEEPEPQPAKACAADWKSAKKYLEDNGITYEQTDDYVRVTARKGKIWLIPKTFIEDMNKYGFDVEESGDHKKGYATLTPTALAPKMLTKKQKLEESLKTAKQFKNAIKDCKSKAAQEYKKQAEAAIDDLEKQLAKETQAVNKTTRMKHQVGDIHPTKGWIWTEYQPGKFDWRINKNKAA